jgi:hypothetical protein
LLSRLEARIDQAQALLSILTKDWVESLPSASSAPRGGEQPMENGTKKRAYVKPQVTSHGAVEDVTAWIGSGSGEFFGGNQASGGAKVAYRNNGAGISHLH